MEGLAEVAVANLILGRALCHTQLCAAPTPRTQDTKFARMCAKKVFWILRQASGQSEMSRVRSSGRSKVASWVHSLGAVVTQGHLYTSLPASSASSGIFTGRGETWKGRWGSSKVATITAPTARATTAATINLNLPKAPSWIPWSKKKTKQWTNSKNSRTPPPTTARRTSTLSPHNTLNKLLSLPNTISNNLSTNTIKVQTLTCSSHLLRAFSLKWRENSSGTQGSFRVGCTRIIRLVRHMAADTMDPIHRIILEAWWEVASVVRLPSSSMDILNSHSNVRNLPVAISVQEFTPLAVMVAVLISRAEITLNSPKMPLKALSSSSAQILNSWILMILGMFSTGDEMKNSRKVRFDCQF